MSVEESAILYDQHTKTTLKRLSGLGAYMLRRPRNGTGILGAHVEGKERKGKEGGRMRNCTVGPGRFNWESVDRSHEKISSLYTKQNKKSKI